MNNEIIQRRKKSRLEGYDYSQNGAYFVTICTKDRMNLFGNLIVGATVPGRPSVKLSEIGNLVNTAILHNNRNGIIIDHYVIMPNHIHMIVTILTETGDRRRSPLQTVIRNMKAYVTKKLGFSPWQKSFHDHIIRNDAEYQRIWRYIKENPAQWFEDRYYRNDVL